MTAQRVTEASYEMCDLSKWSHCFSQTEEWEIKLLKAAIQSKKKTHNETISVVVAHACVCALYRNVECRPTRVIPFPDTGDGRVLPPCRSSIERLQDLDLSITASGLFSRQSPSKLSHWKHGKFWLSTVFFSCHKGIKTFKKHCYPEHS